MWSNTLGMVTRKDLPPYWNCRNCWPLNYRPISLTSVLSNIMKHYLTNLTSHVESNNFIQQSEHGFRKVLSREMQLATFASPCAHYNHQRHPTEEIFLNSKESFDKVPLWYLLNKFPLLNRVTFVLTWNYNVVKNGKQYSLTPLLPKQTNCVVDYGKAVGYGHFCC